MPTFAPLPPPSMKSYRGPTATTTPLSFLVFAFPGALGIVCLSPVGVLGVACKTGACCRNATAELPPRYRQTYVTHVGYVGHVWWTGSGSCVSNAQNPSLDGLGMAELRQSLG